MYKNFILLIFIWIFVSCNKDKPADMEMEELSQEATELLQSFAERIPQVSDDFKVNIYELQEKIKIDPDNVELRKEYCDSAYSAEKMVMVTIGIARLTNPETGEQITRSLVERSAKLDAMRWAMYGTNWLMFDYQPAFSEIKGEFTRKTEVIDKVVVGDSLFLYLASDLSN